MSKHEHPLHPDETPDVSDISNVDVSHEETDVNVGMLFKFIGVLFVSTVVILAAMQLMMNYFQAREISEELPPASRVNPPGTRRLPPLPRLQGAPGSLLLPLDEMKKFREDQNLAVNSYGWVDKPTGLVRIPIEEAKKRLLERGLPVRAMTPVSASTGSGSVAASPVAAQKPPQTAARGAKR